MATLTANPANEEPRRQQSLPGMTSAMDTIRTADKAADRIHARRTAAAQAVVTDADWAAITNFLEAAA